MIQWLQKYSGLKTKDENIEKIEIKNLRKEMKHYKKKYEKENKEMSVEPPNEEEISPDVQKNIDEEMRKKRQKLKGIRQPISAEVYGKYNREKDYNPKIFEKSSKDKDEIKANCKDCFLFKLEPNDLNKVIDAFEKKEYKTGETIIKQDDSGDRFFLVEKGELDCFKTFRPDDPPTYLTTFKSGQTFGELFLLYSEPSPNTIIVKTDAALWFLDRESYKSIIKNSNIQRRNAYEQALKNIDLFRAFNQSEYEKICDVMQTILVKESTEIIKQNEPVDSFYILYDGACHSEKTDGKSTQNLGDLKQYDYFGELTLSKGESKGVTVKADSDCVLFTIERKTFKRLLGPLENISKRNY